MRALSYVAGMAAIVAASLVFAQAESPSRGANPPYVPPPDNGYNGYMYPYQSSTAAEGYGHGLADVIRSAGQANLSNSAAAVNWTEARRRQIENQRQWTETYFAMREINQRAREAERARHRGNPEDWVRYAQAGKPKLLSSHELDAVTGEIHWPILLTSTDFDSQRGQLEKLFADRAYHGVMASDDYLAVVRLTREMLDGIKAQIRDVPANQYMAAKRFLESLAYEASLPSG